MGRAERRQFNRESGAEGRRRQKLPWSAWEDVSMRANWIRSHIGAKTRPNRCWINNKYTVQLYTKKNVFFDRQWDLLMIRRNDAAPLHSWTDLQRLKNELFGPETQAIEFYPKQSELTDVANMYWLWIETGTYRPLVD